MRSAIGIPIGSYAFNFIITYFFNKIKCRYWICGPIGSYVFFKYYTIFFYESQIGILSHDFLDKKIHVNNLSREDMSYKCSSSGLSQMPKKLRGREN